MSLISSELKAKPKWKLGVVVSRFNEDITEKLMSGALDRFMELGVKPSKISVVTVPGAVEIPLIAQQLLKKGHHGVLALGAVIRGETTHYDYVCNSVERGCSQVALDTGKPVVFGVLTTEDEQQAYNRVGGTHGHKGREGADTLIEMIGLLEKIKK